MRKRKLSDLQKKDLETFSYDSSRSSKEIHRALAILMLNENVSTQLLEKLAGYSRQHAYKLEKRYLEKGQKGIESPKKEPKRLLTKNQFKAVITALQKTTPKDYGYESVFWSTAILGNIIYEQYGVKYKSRTSLYILFKKANFSFHKPGSKYYPRDDKKVAQWYKETKKKFKALFKEEKTVVLAEDEMIFLTQTTFQKIWLPTSNYPKIDISVTRKRRCVYGFLNLKNGCEHAFIGDGANSEETIKALKKIGTRYKSYKIVIIWDNAGWHKSKAIKAFLKSTKSNFHLINFPPYAPDLNPQEHVWKKARAQISHNKFIHNIEEASRKFGDYLNSNLFKYRFLDFVAS